jgi:hypothetical protein
VDTLRLSPGGLVMSAHQHVEQLVGAAVKARAEEPGRLDGAIAALDDIFAVGRAALRAYEASSQVPPPASGILAELRDPGHLLPRAQRRYGPRHYDALPTAFAVALARQTLRCGPGQPDPDVMQWLAGHEMQNRSGHHPGEVLKHWEIATPALKARS